MGPSGSDFEREDIDCNCSPRSNRDEHVRRAGAGGGIMSSLSVFVRHGLSFQIAFAIIIIVAFLSSSCAATDEPILLALKQNLRDPGGRLANWKNSSLALNNGSYCGWTHVVCDSNNRSVIQLQLGSLGLGGIISPEIGGLQFLEKLDVSHNNFADKIPKAIGNLTSLTFLDLSFNAFSGPIPSEIGNCSKLTNLLLSNNTLTGSVPVSIGKLSLLQRLQVADNKLSSELIFSSGSFKSITYVDLSGNNLFGPLSPSFGDLQFLANLNLRGNLFNDSIPNQLGNLTSLKTLDLRSNQLGGPIPLEIGNCSKLTSLLLSSNGLTGSFPISLGKLPLLQQLHVANNRLSSEFTFSSGSFISVTDVDLSANQLVGHLSSSFGNCTKLALLNISSNQLTGPIPATLGNLGYLQRLHLGYNSLSGEFPGLNFSAKLGDLGLAHNRLGGSLPDHFDKALALTDLDLSHNYFKGLIPSSLGNCQSLLTLNLSHNQFTGSIPETFGNTNNFQIRLDLSHNNLSGSIPASLSYLNSTTFDLSGNLLSGSIPFNAAKLIQYLDLSRNNLSGSVPPGLASPGATLKGYLQFDLSNNNLSGSVDAFDNNSNFSSRSFLPGNKDLCGAILNRTCPKIELPPGPAPARGPEGSWIHLSWKARVYVWTGGAIVAYLLFVVIALWLYILYIRSKRLLETAVTTYGRGFQLVRLTLKDLMTATNNFDQSHKIGWGGTSTVYKGFLPFYPFVIAVKKFENSETGRQRLMKEACIMRCIAHRNLVGTLGISSIPKMVNVLVLEYMENGTLNHHLHSDDVGAYLSWDERLQIAIDVAMALCYLHDGIHQNIAVIHGDIKPANIFLDSNRSAKVGDFGLAKILTGSKDCRIQRSWEGTFGYSPPEHAEGLISTAGDVYSFGVVLLEMVTRRRPTNFSAFEEFGGSFTAWVCAAFQMPEKLSLILDPHLAASGCFETNGDAIQLLVRVGLLCARDKPCERPTMREALDMLKVVAMSGKRGRAESDATTQYDALPSIEDMVQWGPYDVEFKVDKRDWIEHIRFLDFDKSAGSNLDDDSWFSLYQLDMRDSKVLKALGLKDSAIMKIREGYKESQRTSTKRGEPRKSWIKSVWAAFWRRRRREVVVKSLLMSRTANVHPLPATL